MPRKRKEPTNPMLVRVPDELKPQNVDVLALDPAVTQYLHAHGIETVQDFIDHQFELPKKYFVAVTMKFLNVQEVSH